MRNTPALSPTQAHAEVTPDPRGSVPLDGSPLLRNIDAFPPEAGLRPQVQDMRTENIAALANRARQLGDVIPLWYGEGDMATPSFIVDAAKAALDGGNTFYIPDMRGFGPLVEALSDYQSRLHGRPIGVPRSTIAPGGMQALMLALLAIVDLGTNVVYVEPQWPNIHSAVHLVGGEPRPVPLQYDTDWRLDLDRLFARCDARTRAIVFSTPANPTGWTASREELQALLDFSRRTGVWIISDEVYNRLYFEADAAPSILALADDEDRVFSVNSFSKAWAMTGWRIGWLSHPAGIAQRIGAMTQYVNSGTSGAIQAAAAAAITRGEPFVAEVRARLRAGLDLAYDRLSAVPGIRLPGKPRGGMYAFFSIDGEPDSGAACAKILERARVGLAPGTLFGESSRPFIRLCVFRDPAELDAALGRVVHALA